MQTLRTSAEQAHGQASQDMLLDFDLLFFLSRGIVIRAARMSVKDAVGEVSKAVLKGGKDMKGLHNFISEIRNYILSCRSCTDCAIARVLSA